MQTACFAHWRTRWTAQAHRHKVKDRDFALADEMERRAALEEEVEMQRRVRCVLLNAKRLNWISAELRAKGWTAPAITQEEYPDYFGLLFFTYDDYIRSVLSPLTCPNPAEPLNCKG